MQNGFQLHSQNHTSASSINMWANAPHMWIAQYLFGKRSEFGAAAKAGVLAEDAVTNVIARGFTLDAAIASAVDEYNKFTALVCTDSEKKRGEALPGMITLAVEALKPYGEPTFEKDLFGKFIQRKVELTCNGEGWSLPIVGYTDFIFEKAGVCIDLKTSMKLVTDLSASHLRQACIYQRALGNMRVSFLYVTGKKSNLIECPDVTDTLAEIKAILTRQERFLALGNADLLRSIVPVNTETFYNDAAITREMYGV